MFLELSSAILEFKKIYVAGKLDYLERWYNWIEKIGAKLFIYSNLVQRKIIHFTEIKKDTSWLLLVSSHLKILPAPQF